MDDAQLQSVTTIPDLVRRAAAVHGDRVAIEEGELSMSFRDLDAARLEAAAAFIALGVGAGERVAIWAPNMHQWIVAAVGLQSIGAVLVPINTRVKGFEAADILDRTAARVLVTVGAFLGTDYPAMLRDQALPHLKHIVLLDDAPGEDPPPSVESHAWADFIAGKAKADLDALQGQLAGVAADDLSDILFTSGTTGSPKGVMTTHGQNLRTFRAWTDLVGLNADDRYLIVNPFFHAFGYKAGWLSALMRGATVLPHPVFDVDAVLARIGADRVSVLPGPPTLYQSLLAHPQLGTHDLSNLRLAVTGAATIPVRLIERMREELRFDTVITGYGLTESSGVVTMCREDDDPTTIATTCGRGIEGVEVRCVDDAGASVPVGEPGEVVVRGYNVMKGYLDDPDATAETIDEDGFLHTGDIGVMNERGYLRITDRKKDMFIMGGFNCYPAEIENLMLKNDAFAQVAVIGVPDERMGEVGMAFVVPGPGSTPTPEEVVAWCREHMANYKVPRRVEILETLPLNASGKVKKFELRQRAAGGDA